MSARILDVSPDEYHELSQFNVSTAKVLIDRSALHAKTQHGKKPTKEMDFGTVGHTLVLGKGKRFEVLNFDDYRKDAAKEARDAAREEGKTPILAKDFERAEKLAARLTKELADRGLTLSGASEVALEWEEEGGVLCRCMFDHVWLETGAMLDLKFTANAGTSAVERNAENMNYAMQDAAYRRAMRALKPELAGREDFIFAFCETEEPFAVNVVRGDGVFRELGERRWLRAVRDWDHCKKANFWPAYGVGVNSISAPAWALAREEYL
jgi:hypothetical protein